MPAGQIDLATARRIALSAQGFGRPRSGAADLRAIQTVIRRLGQFQIDTINVVQRAHYLPLYSRLGNYDITLLDRAVERAPRRLFEYWGHAASLLDVSLQPALRFRMDRAHQQAWGSMRRMAIEQPDLVAHVLDRVRSDGPLVARDLEDGTGRQRPHWGWNWSPSKTALEWLFFTGELTSAGRNPQFERRYDIPERVLPAAVLAAETPSEHEAHLHLVRRAAIALGIGSLTCFADYFRTERQATVAAVRHLEAAGELIPVTVSGWRQPAWRWWQAKAPRTMAASALISPFDSLIFERRRARMLFELEYTIEIYVPAAKRTHGYYVYPFLLGDRFAARVDLKANRATGVLEVRSAWREVGHPLPVAQISAALASELSRLAGWLGMVSVQVERKGDLAADLSRVAGGFWTVPDRN